MQFIQCQHRLPSEINTYHVRWLSEGLPIILGACFFNGREFEVDTDDHTIGSQPDEWLEMEIIKIFLEEPVKVPLSCKGVKCMLEGCDMLASHKIGEENIWMENPECGETEEFFRARDRHNDTTYVCHQHFEFIMDRDVNYNVLDDRFKNSIKPDKTV